MGWRDTLGTLLSVVRPWRGTLVATILLGVARVAAFIGVGVLSALVVAAIRDGREIQALIIALLATAPLAALFHWLRILAGACDGVPAAGRHARQAL